MMFLIETKCDHKKLEIWRVKLGFGGKLVVNSIGRLGGLCLFWSSDVLVKLLSFSLALINVRI